MAENFVFAADGLYVLAVDAPQTAIRTEARQRVRAALRATLGELLGAATAEISLISQPGNPLRLAPPWAQIGLSVSHEEGLSLAAINLNGEVGIDLVGLAAPFADLEAVARDYLGPAATLALMALPPEHRTEAFARAWARHEACLKCLALPLQEWTPALASILGTCSAIDLPIKKGLLAVLATRPKFPGSGTTSGTSGRR